MVSTSDCGSENPGSNPGSGNFLLLFFKKESEKELQKFKLSLIDLSVEQILSEAINFNELKLIYKYLS